MQASISWVVGKFTTLMVLGLALVASAGEEPAQCGWSAPKASTLQLAGLIPAPATPLFAMDGPLRAAIDCPYGSESCSPCVRNAFMKLTRPSLDVSNRSFSFHINTGHSIGSRGHIQGVARLADVVHEGQRTGRMVLTHNVWDNGLVYAERTFADDGRDVLLRSPRDMDVLRRVAIRDTYHHPGGAQAHGDTVAVGMEQGPDAHPAAVFFFRFPKDGEPHLVQHLILDGTHGEPDHTEDQTGASAAAFVKLVSGRYLLAVSGTNHGRQGIWFYQSAPTPDGINARIDWRFTGFWKPSCTTGHDRLDECFGGASGMSLIADCSGNILLATFHGTHARVPFRPEFQWMQLYRVKRAEGGGVDLDLLYWQRDQTGLHQTNNPAFRWAGGLYITADRRPAVFNTERRTNVRDNGGVDGDVYLAQP